jgi:hypothetical protein
VNVRPGEYAQTGVLSSPLILMGDTRTVHVRVDVDENDAWRFRSGVRAKAFLRGNSAIAFDMSFAYVEPYVVPKTSLTGASTERVDTRVLQVVFGALKAELPIYAGQQVDVYIETLAGQTAPEKGQPDPPVPATGLTNCPDDGPAVAVGAGGLAPDRTPVAVGTVLTSQWTRPSRSAMSTPMSCGRPSRKALESRVRMQGLLFDTVIEALEQMSPEGRREPTKHDQLR